MNYLPFHEALEDCSRLAGKVPQASCIHEGNFPVIGQGKQAVEGFTNDLGLVFRGDLPVILFGDHTATFKFIDRPFARGADGTKLFRPRTEHLDAKFAWHFLQTVQLPQSGYDRKTKYLENVEIPLPPLEEQRRIAAILDKASSLSSRLACAVQLEDEFNASLFEKLVGDPVVNVKDFPRVHLADLCASADDIKCGPFGNQLKQHEFRSTGVPLWGIKHVNRRFEIATSEFLEEDTATRLSAYSLEPGDIVMTRKGTVGNCSVYPDRLSSGVMHSDLLRIRLDETRCLPSFAAYQLHHSTDIKRQIDLISGGAIMAGINVGRLKEVKIVLPSLDIQKEFESLASRGSWLVWQKNQGMIRISRELLQSLSGSFFLGSQSGQTKT
jgi:type I restriction enzyme, S subunit